MWAFITALSLCICSLLYLPKTCYSYILIKESIIEIPENLPWIPNKWRSCLNAAVALSLFEEPIYIVVKKDQLKYQRRRIWLRILWVFHLNENPTKNIPRDQLGRCAHDFFARLCKQSDEIVPRVKLDPGVFSPKRNLVTKFVGPGQSCRKGKSSWKQRNCACHRA